MVLQTAFWKIADMVTMCPPARAEFKFEQAGAANTTDFSNGRLINC
jgi:hypothetical protein